MSPLVIVKSILIASYLENWAALTDWSKSMGEELVPKSTGHLTVYAGIHITVNALKSSLSTRRARRPLFRTGPCGLHFRRPLGAGLVLLWTERGEPA